VEKLNENEMLFGFPPFWEHCKTCSSSTFAVSSGSLRSEAFCFWGSHPVLQFFHWLHGAKAAWFSPSPPKDVRHRQSLFDGKGILFKAVGRLFFPLRIVGGKGH